MPLEYEQITERYKRISDDIADAMARYRSPEDKVRLMAVTKTVPPDAVNHALGLGIDLIGENRVQEYLSKREAYLPVERHFIGHLQTNKVSKLIPDMELIHSVDSLKLAEAINTSAASFGKRQKILIEVNIGGELSKSGVAPEALYDLICRISELPNIEICGLMTIPPPDSEKYLYNMQKLYVDISSRKLDNVDMSVLSMGMSGDYVNAIKYGSTLIRLGSALFGARNYV